MIRIRILIGECGVSETIAQGTVPDGTVCDKVPVYSMQATHADAHRLREEGAPHSGLRYRSGRSQPYSQGYCRMYLRQESISDFHMRLPGSGLMGKLYIGDATEDCKRVHPRAFSSSPSCAVVTSSGRPSDTPPHQPCLHPPHPADPSSRASSVQ